MNNILPALIGALIGGSIAFIGSLYLKYQERSEYFFDKYLNRLKMSNEEVFIRINELLHRSAKNDLELLQIDKFEELSGRDPEWYNEYGAFLSTTAYYLSWLFYCIDKVKREIPHFKLGRTKSIDLMNSLFELQHSFLDKRGIYYGIQMSIGREMEDLNGDVISYRIFCEKLIHPESRIWFKRLFYLLIDFKKGNRFDQFYEIKEKTYELSIILDKMAKTKKTLDARIRRESYNNYKRCTMKSIILKGNSDLTKRIDFVTNLFNNAEARILHSDSFRQKNINYAMLIFAGLFVIGSRTEEYSLQIVISSAQIIAMLLFAFWDRRWHKTRHGWEYSRNKFRENLIALINDPVVDIEFLPYYSEGEKKAELKSLLPIFYYILVAASIISFFLYKFIK
jgi:hypothetical protein